MALRIDSSLSQYLMAPLPVPVITGYPYCVGCWVRDIDTANARTIWEITDTGATNHWASVEFSNTAFIRLGAASGGAEDLTTHTPVDDGTWNHVIARFITATNRRIHLLEWTGTQSTATDTTSRTPTGLDTMVIGAHLTSAGASEFMNGDVAELWVTNGDIFGPSLDIGKNQHNQIAYGGPLSFPPIAQNLVDYQSFRRGIDSLNHQMGDVDQSRRALWTPVNGGGVLAPHPPLPYWHERPFERRWPVVV